MARGLLAPSTRTAAGGSLGSVRRLDHRPAGGDAQPHPRPLTPVAGTVPAQPGTDADARGAACRRPQRLPPRGNRPTPQSPQSLAKVAGANSELAILSEAAAATEPRLSRVAAVRAQPKPWGAERVESGSAFTGGWQLSFLSTAHDPLA